MNKITIISVISVIVFVLSSIGYVSLDYFENPEPQSKPFAGLTCEEIRKLNNIGIIVPKNDTTFSQKRIFDCLEEELEPITIPVRYDYSHSFSDDPSGKLKEWCIENNGNWDIDDVQCGFTNKVQSMKADTDLESRTNGKVTGLHAKAICNIVQIPCPDNPEFNGSYSMNLARTYVTQYKYQVQYTFYFDDDDLDKLAYRICDTEHYDKYDDDCQWQKVYVNKLIRN